MTGNHQIKSMRKHLLRATRLGLVVASISVAGMGIAQSHDGEKMGKLHFKTSCVSDAQEGFEQGLLLLHHMMYEQAETVFADAASTHPDCAMLNWGVAMSKFHPLWPGLPSAEALASGREAIGKAGSNATPREADYVAAVRAFYEGADTGYRARIGAWAKAQKAVFDKYPDDVDAGALYALSHLATAPRGDKTLAHQKTSSQLLEKLLKDSPKHPGLNHYLIHAYDSPPLAESGLDVSRKYGAIAPDVPHALHMPSHIFVRRGLWQPSIDWNVKSAQAALSQPKNGMIPGHFAHAMDYLIYSMLQLGDVSGAQRQLDRLLAVQNHAENFGVAYALSASPARLALEREDWKAAANLSVNGHPAVTWAKFPNCVSITHFAKGIGAARSDNQAGAEAALKALAKLREPMVKTGQKYWVILLDAQVLAIEAWKTMANGDGDKALDLMRQSADLEDSVGKSPVTPSTVIPARELLGDMLAMLDQPKAAHTAYEAALKISPNRRRSLSGLQRMAQAAK